MAYLLDSGLHSIIDTASAIGASWTLTVYSTGTTTLLNTYPTEADALAGTNANANPVTLGADGRLPPMWINGPAKGVLKNAAGTTIKTIDPLASVASTEGYSVLNVIPANLHASIAAGTITTNLSAYFDTAATYAINNKIPLHIPGGTYTMLTWAPPANLVVTTAGFATILKQLNTSGSQRFVRVLTDNVSLWPGGQCSFDGSLTASVNNTSFNSAVYVYAGDGVTINRFTIGDTYVANMGGDGVETGTHSAGTLVHCEIGTVFCNNVYRNGISITGGRSGNIRGLVQLGGIGLIGMDFEPDPTSGSPPVEWNIDLTRCHRVNFVGDPAVGLGNIRVGVLHSDYDNFAVSSPAYDYAGVNAAASPTLFQAGLRYRCLKNLNIGQAYIAGFPYYAISEITGGGYCETVHIGSLETYQCGDHASSPAEISVYKTYDFKINYIKSVDKVSNADGTFYSSGVADNRITVLAGRINGRIADTISGHLRVENLIGTGASTNIFRSVTGTLHLRGFTCASATVMFDACATAAVVEDSTLGATTMISGGAAQARYYRSTIDSVYYDDGWATATAAVASAAAIALPKTGNVIPISGTTNITSITSDVGHKARTVTLVFQGVLTFTDGSNLALAGNFVTTADDTITLATADGATWYEVCRSVN